MSILAGFALLFAVGFSERISKCSNDLDLYIPSPSGPTENSIETTLLAGRRLKEVEITVNLDHTHVADLTVTVKHVESDKSVILFKQMCGEDDDEDLNTIFSDAAKKALICENHVQGIRFRPFEALSKFDGLSYERNTWTISIDDYVTGDSGSLDSWCVSYDDSVPRYVALDERTSSMGRARERCRESLGTDLAVIRDAYANLEGTRICAETCDADYDCKGCWIGLDDLLKEGEHTWIDGSALTFENFKRGEPDQSGGNQDCVDMKPSEEYQWHDRSCDSVDRIPLCRNPDYCDNEKSTPLTILRDCLLALADLWTSSYVY